MSHLTSPQPRSALALLSPRGASASLPRVGWGGLVSLGHLQDHSAGSWGPQELLQIPSVSTAPRPQGPGGASLIPGRDFPVIRN